MIIKRLNSYYPLFRTRRITTCAIQVEPPSQNFNTKSPTGGGDHKSQCFSLIEQLIKKGLKSSAQQVIHRMIGRAPSVSDAISAVDFGISRGVELDIGSFGAIMRKLIESGEPQSALSLYANDIEGMGIAPDPSILNYLIICFCKLGKLEDAIKHLDRLDHFPGTSACNAIIIEFCAQERFLEAFDFFVRICDLGVNLKLRSYNVLIDGFCQKGYLNEALKMFDIMRERTKLGPTLHNYKSLFYGLCRNGRAVEAELLFTEMESHGYFIDRIMYTSLIKGYCKDKKMKLGMRVFYRMLKTGCDPDSYTFKTLIHGFVKMGLSDKGWVLCKQMGEWALQPDVVTYHIMISNYCKKGKVNCAFMLLENMVSRNVAPSVHCYTTLIAALYKDNRVADVNKLYSTMLENGIGPDHVLAFILMKKCPNGQQLQLALQMLQAFAKNACGFELPILSSGDLKERIEVLLEEIVKRNMNVASVAFGIYISALSMEGKMEDAFMSMDKMVNHGCKPLLSTCNTLIRCHCQEGLFHYAKSLIELMQECAIVPDMATYLILVDEYCKQGDVTSAIDVLDELDERELKPGVCIYDVIIGRLFEEKRIFEAEQMFKRMLEAGVDPDEILYTTMVNGYAKNGIALEARQFFEKMIEHSIQPSLYSYTALISGLVKRGMVHEGCVYLTRMRRDGLVPNVVLYTNLISHFLRKGDFEFAFRLVDLMDKNELEYDLIACIGLLSGVCRNITDSKRWFSVARGSERAREMLLHSLHQKTLIPIDCNLRVSNSPEGMKCYALKLIQKVKEVQFMPDLYLYNGIISGFCGAGKMNDAYDHFEMMQKQGIHPNHVTFTILIVGHMRAGELDHVIRLYNKMNFDGCAPDRITYNALLRGLCKARRLVDALSIFCAMNKQGFFPNKVSYDILLRSLCNSNSSIDAFKIFEEMVANGYLPCVYSHNWLFEILSEKRKLHEARIVFDMMCQ